MNLRKLLNLLFLASILTLSACEQTESKKDTLLLNALQKACHAPYAQSDCDNLKFLALKQGISRDRVSAAMALSMDPEAEKALIEKYQ